jgi:hypothetical protein
MSVSLVARYLGKCSRVPNDGMSAVSVRLVVVVLVVQPTVWRKWQQCETSRAKFMVVWQYTPCVVRW